VPRLEAGRLEIAGEGFHYLVHVLRARRGDAVVLFDGAGREADATVEAVSAGALVLAVGPSRAAAGAAVAITLLLGILKGEKMDLVVQKATELGAARVVPLATARAVVRLQGSRGDARRVRWERIAREAARQARRADVPEIAPPAALADALAASPATALRLLFHEGDDAGPLRPALEPPAPSTVAVAIGPEGGFAPDEVALARDAGFQVVGLGKRVLRAETAAIAALAIVGYALDRG
jgi:16S rRNA (uracil1498-N3)-methyltransferase